VSASLSVVPRGAQAVRTNIERKLAELFASFTEPFFKALACVLCVLYMALPV
jgi:hypothetical protein